MHQLARDPRNTDSKDPPATIYTITGDFRQCQHEDLILKHAWHQALNPDDHVLAKDLKLIDTVTRKDVIILNGGDFNIKLCIKPSEKICGPTDSENPDQSLFSHSYYGDKINELPLSYDLAFCN
ncbi:hypothetical protein NDU88_004273 [Pleurodeles waltl]|uniref:Uncharacterized protein n=1 Tax=Pleurodeles waltl TaxID=8319 RepID=A0AAV7MT03_PLEWA|nr:hypothetical protein NDU88_004273 [Pleurodeles waltl]